MNIERISVESIHVPPRRREVDEAEVRKIAESISKIGLQSPPAIRIVDEMEIDGEEVMAVPVLIYGLHRLRAVQSLGHKWIECAVFKVDARQAERMEIAENLHRNDLTVLQRANDTARWIDLTEEDQKGEGEDKQAQVAPVSKGGRGNEGGINAASRELGIERTEAQRAVKIAGLSDDAKQVAEETGLDKNQSVLLKAATQKDDVAFLRSEHDRREAERARKELEKHNKDVDTVVRLTTAEEFANFLLGLISLEQLPTVLSWVEGTKPKDVASALRRLSA